MIINYERILFMERRVSTIRFIKRSTGLEKELQNFTLTNERIADLP